jgi:hypothetical protein
MPAGKAVGGSRCRPERAGGGGGGWLELQLVHPHPWEVEARPELDRSLLTTRTDGAVASAPAARCSGDREPGQTRTRGGARRGGGGDTLSCDGGRAQQWLSGAPPLGNGGRGGELRKLELAREKERRGTGKSSYGRGEGNEDTPRHSPSS